MQGLAKGLGYLGPVTSPTFTLSQIYQLPHNQELHHYDLYRLQEAGIVGQELSEDIGQPHVITVIEWAGVAETLLPTDRLIISFNVTAETSRDLTFTATGPISAALIKDVVQ